ncbi:MAG: glycosyltransferase [Planctomycetota bacterium]
MPELTVVMACYNAMPYLPAAVQSIRDQTLTDWEMVIVNDGSSDHSPAYLHEVAGLDSRIRVLDQENLGQQAAANRGIAAARTDLIARMDADDIAEPERFEKQLNFMRLRPDVGLLGGQIRRLGKQRSGMESSFPTEHDQIVDHLLKNRHAICNPTVILRKSLFERIGGYWEHNIAEDWDLFLRMGEVSRLANLRDLILSYRFHTGSINGRRIVEAQLYNEFAAELAIRRANAQQPMGFHEFLSSHRSRRWPMSWLFYFDSQSIGQYREAIAEIYSGNPLVGYARLGLSAAMSPGRTIRRLGNMARRWS